MTEQDKKIMELALAGGYEVKNLKTFKGMEGVGGYNAVLCRQGKKIAEVINDDSGGETMWSRLSAEEDQKLKNLCAAVPAEDYEGIKIECDRNIFIDALINDTEDKRYWKRMCSKHACVILKTHKLGEYLKYKDPYTPELAKLIRKRLGDNLLEIINERFLAGVKK